jgi:hypothetical protein
VELEGFGMGVRVEEYEWEDFFMWRDLEGCENGFLMKFIKVLPCDDLFFVGF